MLQVLEQKKHKWIKDTRVKNLLKLGYLQIQLNKVDAAIVSYKKFLDLDINCEKARDILPFSITNYSKIFSIKQATVVPINIRSHHEWVGGVSYPNDMPPIFRHRRKSNQGVTCIDIQEIEQNRDNFHNTP
ncbi:hypothetical protein RZS08_06715, partial [Arthrospira platensis SPKY1]|nr:hypothetical protein [Arthrospira platensis SPKY1]